MSDALPRLSRRHVLGVATAAAAAGLVPFAPPSRAGPRTGILGDMAPPLTADFWIDAEGQPTTFTMSELEGRWACVECFQSWCPGCHSHGLPALKRIADAFLDEPRVGVLAVQTVFEGFSVNTPDKLRATQLRYELPIKMGNDAGDPDGDHVPATMRRYRTGGTPWVVIVDPSGRVVFNDFHVDPDKFIDFLRAELG